MAKENQTGNNTVPNDGQDSLVHQIKDGSVSLLRDDVLGAKEWKNSKVGWLLGISPFIRVGSSMVKMVSEPFSTTWTAGRKFFSVVTAPALPTEDVDPSVRFAVAKNYYERSNADIDLDITATSKWFSIYFVVTALLIGYCMVALFHIGRTIMPWWGEVVTDFALLPAAFAMAAQMGFQNWQLRTTRLGSFREYALNPSVWLAEPASNGKNGSGPPGGGLRKGSRGVSRLAMALMVTASLGSGAWLAVGSADAQPSPSPGGGIANSVSAVLTAPDKKDIWVTMLTYIFPNVGPFSDPSSGNNGLMSSQEIPQSKAIRAAFATFLSVLMALSSSALAYFTLVGTISTAHEGKVMGQRWHTFYAPVRVVAGFGMLVPVVNGYCLAQLLVLYIAVWGGSLGNAIWSGYVETLGSQQVSPKADAVQLGILYKVLVLEGCRQTSVLNSQLSQPNYVGSGARGQGSARGTLRSQVPGGIPEWVKVSSGISVMATNNLPTFMGGTTGTRQAYQLSFGACGTIDVNSTVDGDPAFSRYDTAVRTALHDYLVAISPYVADNVAKLNLARNAETLPDPVLSVLTNAVDTFNNTLSVSQAALMDGVSKGSSNTSMETLKTNMKQWGWASAGTFYMAISNVYSSYATTAARMPEGTVGPILERYSTDTSTIPAIRNVNSALSAAWNQSIQDFANMSKTPDLASTAVAMARLNTSEGTGSQKFEDILQAPMLKRALSILQIDLSKGSGLDHMVAFGHSVLMVWGIIVAVLVGVQAFGIIGSIALGASLGVPGMIAGGVAGKIIGGVMGSLAGMIQMLLILILSVGIVHAYVLPMIPYIMMMFFIIGMLTLVVEGVVAAPLWALFHIRPDGQEFIESVQKPGYMILFNLLLRVPLALFGMFFSFLLVDALMWFESITFIPAFLSISANESYGIFGILAAVGLVGFLHYQICIRSFGLITHLPDHVARWFGGSGENLDEKGHTDRLVGGVISRAENKITTLGGGAAVAKLGGGGGGSPGKQPQDPSKADAGSNKGGSGQKPSTGGAPSTNQE